MLEKVIAIKEIIQIVYPEGIQSGSPFPSTAENQPARKFNTFAPPNLQLKKAQSTMSLKRVINRCKSNTVKPLAAIPPLPPQDLLAAASATHRAVLSIFSLTAAILSFLLRASLWISFLFSIATFTFSTVLDNHNETPAKPADGVLQSMEIYSVFLIESE